MGRQQEIASLLLVSLLWGPLPLFAQTQSSPSVTQNSAQPDYARLVERATALSQQVTELVQASRYAEAVPLINETIPLVEDIVQFGETVLGPENSALAPFIQMLADLHRFQGDYAAADALYQRVLSLRKAALGANHPDVAQSLNGLAELYRIQGRYQDAVRLHQQVLAIRREVFSDRHLDVAQSLSNLARVYQIQSRYGEAEPLLQQVLAIRLELLGENHSDVANSLDQLAGLYAAQGRYGEAEPLLQQAFAIRRELFGEGHPSIANSLSNLAGLYQIQGRYGQVESLYQQALAIYRELFGERHPTVATELNNLAGFYRIQGLYTEAEPLHQQALSIRREWLGERHPDVATSLNNLALLYIDQGRYGEAEPRLQEALEMDQGAVGERHPKVATSLNNLALLYRLQGRYGEAETSYQQALDIYRERFGERHVTVATSLVNLATLYRVQARYEEAQSLYQQALDIQREQLEEGHPSVAASLNGLALAYQDQGRYEAAEPLFERSLEIYRQQLGEGHPSFATSLSNLAGLYYAQGRYGDAEPRFQEALAIHRQQLGERHPTVATILNNLAVLYVAEGRYGEAATMFAEGLDIEEWNLALNLATLPEVQRQAYAALIAGSTSRSLSLHLQSAPTASETAELALTTLLRRKGRILEVSTNSLQRLRQNLTPEDQAILDRLADTQRQLATLTFNPPPDLAPEQYRARLDDLAAAAIQLETTLARRSAAFRAEAEPITVPAVQAQIPANGALVEYVRYQPFNASDPQNPWGEPRYAAYILLPSGEPRWADLGDAATIDQQIQGFLEVLRCGEQVALPCYEPEELQPVAQSLYEGIFAPLQPHLGSASHLLLSPDGQLNLVPFAALVDGQNRYLVETYTLTHLTSGRDLQRFQGTASERQPPLVLGNPDFETADAAEAARVAPVSRGGARSADLADLRFGPLQGSEQEVEAIRPLLGNDAVVLTQAEATENTLKQVQGPSILHLATHGFFLEDGPVAPSAGTANPDPTQPPQAENPLLRSGLALAGFNQRDSDGEDGVLTALEVAGLNLWGTQLVVLSACETGLGDVAYGEGVYGLRRAFAMAGAESQVMSLWQVSDERTAELIAQYYQRLMAGEGRSEALRQVQLASLQDPVYQHPYYWAAFSLTGQWSPLELP